MSIGRSRAGASAAGANPWLIAVLVALASFMEVLDTTIANVSLNYIAGSLGVSEDEASWVVTTYLVANAIILTASPFLARMLGRKAFFLICLAVFTVSSVLSGIAWNLQSLLVFRILQGFGGGGMVPVAQSILADSFPPEKRGQIWSASCWSQPFLARWRWRSIGGSRMTGSVHPSSLPPRSFARWRSC